MYQALVPGGNLKAQELSNIETELRMDRVGVFRSHRSKIVERCVLFHN